MLKALIQFILVFGYKLKITGLDKLEFSQPTILMPNHVSLLDAAILAVYLPNDVAFVVNTGIARKFAYLLKYRKHITVDPLNPYSIRQMVRVVQNGTPLVMFPEGRITTTGGLMKIFSGSSYIAMKTGAKLFPIIINGAERSKLSYLAGKLNTKLFPEIKVTIGDPFTIPFIQGSPIKRQKLEAAFTIQRVLQKELTESRLKTHVNLFNELLEAARTNGSRMEICEDLQQKLTYKKLIISAYVLSGKFGALLSTENRVGVLLPNANAHVVTLFALFHLGKTPAILNFSAGKQNVSDACETAQLKTVITSRQFIAKGKLELLISGIEAQVRVVYLEDIRTEISLADKAKAAGQYLRREKGATHLHNNKGTSNLRRTQDDNEIILFTSGSESKPKGVILTHTNLYANIQQARSTIDLTSRDKILNALPMFHSFGLTAGTFLPLLCGIQLFVYPSPLHYKVIPEISYDRQATILFGTSTFLGGYGKAAHPYDFFSIRYVLAGAEKLKDDVRELWADKFGIRILEGYGITETSPVLALNTPLAYKKGTVGQLLPGMEYRIEKVEGIQEGGTLFVKGPNVMKGYLLHGKGFIPAEEWYDTGDVVDFDEEGFITIKSRLKRFAKIGGEMVSLNQVEEIAARCFDNPNMAAVSVPDARKGEKLILFSTKPDLKAELLREYIGKIGYSPLFMPAKLTYIEKIPLLGSGKTDYVRLKQLAEQA